MNQMELFNCSPSITSEHKQATSSERSLWYLFVDGASRNNPGKAGAGIYIVKDGKPFLKKGFFLGIKTNNEAEYYALILGLFLIRSHFQAQDSLVVVSDSLLVVRQIEGTFKVKKKELLLLRNLASQMMRHCNDGGIQHVLRHDNVEADAMANEGIDKKNPVPDDFIPMLNQHGIIF